MSSRLVVRWLVIDSGQKFKKQKTSRDGFGSDHPNQKKKKKKNMKTGFFLVISHLIPDLASFFAVNKNIIKKNQPQYDVKCVHSDQYTYC
jgi:hypothetical protein